MLQQGSRVLDTTLLNVTTKDVAPKEIAALQTNGLPLLLTEAMPGRSMQGLRAERQNDLQQALEFYEASAAQDNSYAQNNLACCLKNGTEANLVRSIELLKQSATQGVPAVCYNLGACYANGIGVLPDLKQAEQWYTEGAD